MPLEIERKFLVTAAPTDAEWPVPYRNTDIVQNYLKPRDPAVTSERVRRRDDPVARTSEFTHTTKVRVSDGVHHEEERVVTEAEYKKLLRRAVRSMSRISKVRKVFTWDGQVFELDTFRVPEGGLRILEVELSSQDEEVRLPPFLTVEREVTTDPAYTNAAIARAGKLP